MKILLLSDRANVAEALKDASKPDPTLRLRAARSLTPTTINEGDRTIDFVLSDETTDHAGDVIRAAGWDLSFFEANPVMPWCHMYDLPPIGNWKDVGVVKDKLVGTAVFAKAEDYEFADTIFRLTARGFLKGVSVGFNPTRWNAMRDDQQGFIGYEFLQQQLLECSACTVPMNPSALARSVKEGVVSRGQLAMVITNKILSELDMPQGDKPAVRSELVSRLAKAEMEIEDLKAILEASDDTGGESASSLAPASPELATALQMLAEIKTMCA